MTGILCSASTHCCSACLLVSLVIVQQINFASSECSVVFLLTYVVNRFTGGVRYISFHEQIIMACYGMATKNALFTLEGVRWIARGRLLLTGIHVAGPSWNKVHSSIRHLCRYSLHCVWPGECPNCCNSRNPHQQGCTIKTFVKCLNIRLAKKEDNFRLFNAFNKGMVDQMTQGIEDIIGVKDDTVMKRLGMFSKMYVRPLLQRDYVVLRTEDRLMMIENEETFK